MQTKIEQGEFKEGYLSNGEKIILFNRETLPIFFENLTQLFKKGELNFEEYEEDLEEVSLDVKNPSQDKLHEIQDRNLLSEIKPLLRKNRVLESVAICSKFYGSKYKGMTFKDWFKIVNELYQEVNA